jgi:hypothetical protein
MKLSYVLPVALVASVTAFAPPVQQQRTFGVRPLRMSDETPPKPKPSPSPSPSPSPGGKLVPIKEETVEFTAGILGGLAGLALGGPWLGAIGAALGNYVSKSENDVSDVVNAVSKSSIQVYNYLTTLDSKYELLDKAKNSLESALDKLKSQGNVDPATVEKVESALKSTKDKIVEVNDEYDLVGAGMTALGVVGDLVEKAVVKAGELNEEYKLTDKALESLTASVEKAKEAAAKASS